MRITVLAVPECPNARPALEQVEAALAGRPAHVELVEVSDLRQAAARGMTGSPTILIDGTDPFASGDAVPGLSCRLYRGADGAVSGTPGEEAVRRAVAGRQAPDGEDAAASECCPPSPLPEETQAVDRAGRGRRAPAERGLRAVQQRVLRHFARTGEAPAPQVLQPVAAAEGRTAADVLAELAAEDFLVLDEDGRIRAAYPFSARPTRHRVRLADGVEVWAMCAIDALGIPVMLGTDAVISSTDPVTQAEVAVTVEGGTAVWRPHGAVVFLGRIPGGGPAATACCDALNFFASAASAHTWAQANPEVPGRVVGHEHAEEVARRTFGPLLLP